MQTYTQYPAMIVPLELPMFEGHPLAVTAQLEASQVELTVLHRNAAISHASTSACQPPTIEPTGQLATLTQPTP